jgi:hypothetical protein
MRRTVVDTTFPYPVKWDRGDLEVRIEAKVFEVHFERRYRQQNDARVSGSGVVSATNLEYERDRLGRAAHTYVEIRFPMYVEHDLANQWELLKWVHAVINRVLSVYRYTTEEFHVDTIPTNELRDYTVRTLNADGTFDNRASMVTGGPTGWLIHVPPEPLPNEAQQLLRAGTELPVPKVLYLNAKREEFFENYRMAVVEAETAFEALVDQVVATYYTSRGEPRNAVERKLETSVVNLIQHHIPRCCGAQFEGTTEHSAWHNDLYRLRKDVVHDGAPVNAVQAEKALEAADKAMKWIETRTP